MDEHAILVVDDDPLSLAMLEHLLGEAVGARVVAVPDATLALAWCRTNTPDLVITDYQMPGMDGLALVEALRRETATRLVPIMVITTVEDREVRYRALRLGATDFLGKPIDAEEVKARTRNMLDIRRGQKALEVRAESLAKEVERATAKIAAREQETVLRLSLAAEYRDWETGAHTIRVGWFARLIARGMGLSTEVQDSIFRAAPLHDLGKIGVPDHILLKPGRLDEAEFAIMKEHTVIGYDILRGGGSELMQEAADIALSHHERWDGAGYPHGLAGEAIPLAGRIVAVADVFDALMSERPYKDAWQLLAVMSLLKEGAGSQFDPQCVTAFTDVLDTVLEIRATHPDQPRSSQRPRAVLPSLAQPGRAVALGRSSGAR